MSTPLRVVQYGLGPIGQEVARTLLDKASGSMRLVGAVDVEVDGTPPIDLRFRGGIFGDTATVGMLVNTVPLAASARPGLQTMADLPVPRAFATRSVAAAMP
jgi:hypothetical protein